MDDACASNPCHAGAICDTSPIDGTYMCSCPPGFKGVDCTEDIDECEAGSPCEHDGLCVNTPGSFRCNCTRGFTGPRCEININECDSNPCQNDGTCLDERGAFRCVCMPGKSIFLVLSPFCSYCVYKVSSLEKTYAFVCCNTFEGSVEGGWAGRESNSTREILTAFVSEPAQREREREQRSQRLCQSVRLYSLLLSLSFLQTKKPIVGADLLLLGDLLVSWLGK